MDFKDDMGKTGAIVLKTGFAVLAVVALISLKLLLHGNMSTTDVNEGNVLPLARQYINPSWIPGDWYLNQPAGYRMPSQQLMGRMADAWGFLAASIVGRLLCYTLVAWGLVRIARQLGLSLAGLLVAVGLWVYVGRQGVAAFEWLVGGFEAKAIAYGLIILAISLMLEGHYLWMALLLGFATCFHVLVGGWTFLIVSGWLISRWQSRLARMNSSSKDSVSRASLLRSVKQFGLIVLVYLAGSALIIPPVIQQLATPKFEGAVSPTFVYVFLRSPHHLNPLSWKPEWWIRPFIYLLILGLSFFWLKRQAGKVDHTEAQRHGGLGDSYSATHRLIDSSTHPSIHAQQALAEFTLISLIPFIAGLAIAPFDNDGKFLQYYPFRLGDVMLPLNTTLLFVCVLEQGLSQWRRWFVLGCTVFLAVLGSVQLVDFQRDLASVRSFPSNEQRVTPELQDLYRWIQANTPKQAMVVTPPTGMYNLSWITERPTIANYKCVPQQSNEALVEWFDRLSDLSGGLDARSLAATEDPREAFRETLEAGYDRLSTQQVIALMRKYQATYFATKVSHQLQLPITYQNSTYVLYSKS
jgi:hypothetical protein